VLPRLDGRSNGSLEFKNCNISAALLDLGCPSIDGYKPRWNYQRTILPEVVFDQLEKNEFLRTAIAGFVTASPKPEVEPSGLPIEEDAPGVEAGFSVYDRSPEREFKAKHIDFLDLEARNSALGLKGEEVALDYERNRLLRAGKDSLADRVEHVSRDRGDGAGFDIRSFDECGRDRFIEVKTTNFSKYTPFFITENEVAFSKRYRDAYCLYRLFNFRARPKLFKLSGDIGKNCVLTPSTYRGGFGK